MKMVLFFIISCLVGCGPGCGSVDELARKRLSNPTCYGGNIDCTHDNHVAACVSENKLYLCDCYKCTLQGNLVTEPEMFE